MRYFALVMNENASLPAQPTPPVRDFALPPIPDSIWEFYEKSLATSMDREVFKVNFEEKGYTLVPFESLTGQLLADLFIYYNVEKRMFARAAGISVRTIHNRISDFREMGPRFKEDFMNVIELVHKYRMKHGFDSSMERISFDKDDPNVHTIEIRPEPEEHIKQRLEYLKENYTTKTRNIIEAFFTMNSAGTSAIALTQPTSLMVGKMAECFNVTPDEIVDEALFSWLFVQIHEFAHLFYNGLNSNGEFDSKLKALNELTSKIKALADIMRYLRLEVYCDRTLKVDFGPDSPNHNPEIHANIIANMERHERSLQQYNADFEKYQHEFIKLIDEMGIIDLKKPFTVFC